MTSSICRETKFIKTTINKAVFDGAFFMDVNFSQALRFKAMWFNTIFDNSTFPNNFQMDRDFDGAGFRNCDLIFQQFRNLSPDDIFVDRSVTLPSLNRDRPEHWKSKKLSEKEFKKCHKDWLERTNRV